jgi:hypothetical protein
MVDPREARGAENQAVFARRVEHISYDTPTSEVELLIFDIKRLLPPERAVEVLSQMAVALLHGAFGDMEDSLCDVDYWHEKAEVAAEELAAAKLEHSKALHAMRNAVREAIDDAPEPYVEDVGI